MTTRNVLTVLDILGAKALDTWLPAQPGRCPQCGAHQSQGHTARCQWYVPRSFKLPYGSCKIILHGLPKRYDLDDAIEDDAIEDENPTARDPAQDQKLRDRPILDWRNNHWGGGRQCIHCGLPALLIDDAGRPAHKVCAEQAVEAVLAATHRDRSSAR
jgi:hypothetical protein